MKKTMRKSALLSSVAMLIVSAIVLTSATYAWFSSSKVVSVEELSAKVEVSTGLLISVDKGTSWKVSVNFAQAVPVKSGWGSGIPQKFDPVSTENGNTWMSAIFEDGALKAGEAPIAGTNGQFVAVPLWVTGPVGKTVNATITWDVGPQAAKCVKFALLPTTDGETATSYGRAVPAEANDDNKFMGISAAGTVADTDENKKENAFVSAGGSEITEITQTDLSFTIPAGTSTTQPIKYIAYIWLEGNDKDCAMQLFDVAGENIKFSMQLALAD